MGAGTDGQSARIDSGPREAALAPLALGGAALLALGALAAAGSAPRGLLAPAALYLLLGGAAWPIVVVSSRVVASWLKLGLVSWLLAPVFCLAVWLPLRAGPLGGEAAGDTALALLLGLFAGVQLLGLGRRLRLERPGWASLFALLLGLLFALLVGAWVLAENAPRVSYHGLLHSGVLLATERAVPPTNPWLAGEPLAYYWVWHGLGALIARAFALAPTQALAWTNLWAAAALPLALQLTAAVLWRSGVRELAAVAGALFGLGALSGWVWLLSGAPFTAPGASLELLAEMGRGLPRGADGAPLWDPRLVFAASKFGNLNSYPAALALSVGAWMAAAHALRHGERPWGLCTALLHGGATLINPLVGLVTLLPTAAALLFWPKDAGKRLSLAILIGVFLAPALWLVGEARSAYADEAVSFAPSAAAWSAGLWPVAPLVAAALGALGFLFFGARALPAGEPRRAVVLLLAIGAFGPLVLHGLVQLPYDNQYKLVRLAAWPLGLLAGAGLVELIAAGGARRWLGAGLAALTAIGALANQVHGTRLYLAFARVSLPLEEGPLELLPVGGPTHPWTVADIHVLGAERLGGPDVAAAYAFLRRSPAVRAANPVLLLDAFEPVGHRYGTGEAARPFVERANLQAHEAAAFAALDLWFDRPSQVLSARAPQLERRGAAVFELLRDPAGWSEGHRVALERSGRAAVVLVSVRDRLQTEGLESKLYRFGFAPVWRRGSASLHVFPRGFAEALAAELDAGETPR